MPITSAQYSVGTDALEICSPDRQPLNIWVHNDGAVPAFDVYLGNGSVTTTTGMRLSSDETIMMTLDPGDSLHAISNRAQGVAVHVLVQKQD